MSHSLADIGPDVLCSVVGDILFLPPKLPQKTSIVETECSTDVALCRILIHAAAAFRQYLTPSQESVWASMQKMMVSIHRTAMAPLVETELKEALSDLSVGGGL